MANLGAGPGFVSGLNQGKIMAVIVKCSKAIFFY